MYRFVLQNLVVKGQRLVGNINRNGIGLFLDHVGFQLFVGLSILRFGLRSAQLDQLIHVVVVNLIQIQWSLGMPDRTHGVVGRTCYRVPIGDGQVEISGVNLAAEACVIRLHADRGVKARFHQLVAYYVSVSFVAHTRVGQNRNVRSLQFCFVVAGLSASGKQSDDQHQGDGQCDQFLHRISS